LKPDVCRRVVGRLPSPGSKAGMAPPLSFAFFRIEIQKSLKTVVVYLVRSLGLMPEPISHDWHVQPSCQRPNRGPPRRREFSPGENMRLACARLDGRGVRPYMNSTVLETLQPYSAAKIPSIIATHRISR